MTDASLVITNRCNFKCKMCDIGQKNTSASGLSEQWGSDKEMTPNEWKKVLDKYGINGKVHIIGVEPLLYPRLGKLLNILKDRGCNVYITTNGWFIDKWFGPLSKYCDNIAISIDGLQETHDMIRGVRGAFGRAFNGAVKLREGGCNVRVSYAFTPDNLDDAVPLYKMLHTRGIPIIFNHYNYIHPDSCVGYECKPSNMTEYDPSGMDTYKIYHIFTQCKYATFSPHLGTKEGICKYYTEIPKRRIRLNNAGCSVLNRMLAKKWYAIGSDGTLNMPARCWYPKDCNLTEVVAGLKQNGFPPPCQRLCCAGKVL